MSFREKEFQRMSQWLLISVFLYGFAILLASRGLDFYPQLQTISWKLGHESIAAFMGYWIDRNMCRARIGADSSDLQGIRRAIIIGAAMLGVAMGM